MRTIFIFLAASLLSGCATMGAALGGFSQGMSNYQSNQSRTVNCVTTGEPGLYTTNCY